MPFRPEHSLLRVEIPTLHTIDTRSVENLFGMVSPVQSSPPNPALPGACFPPLALSHRPSMPDSVSPSIVVALLKNLPCHGRRQATGKPQLASLESRDLLLRTARPPFATCLLQAARGNQRHSTARSVLQPRIRRVGRARRLARAPGPPRTHPPPLYLEQDPWRREAHYSRRPREDCHLYQGKPAS